VTGGSAQFKAGPDTGVFEISLAEVFEDGMEVQEIQMVLWVGWEAVEMEKRPMWTPRQQIQLDMMCVMHDYTHHTDFFMSFFLAALRFLYFLYQFWQGVTLNKFVYFIKVVKCICLEVFFLFLLFICVYDVWVISPPAPSLSPLLPSLPGRNYFALISNFVEERV
jgi:hypothetical protein